MNKTRLKINIDAEFGWILPPASSEESAMRERANALAKETAQNCKLCEIIANIKQQLN